MFKQLKQWVGAYFENILLCVVLSLLLLLLSWWSFFFYHLILENFSLKQRLPHDLAELSVVANEYHARLWMILGEASFAFVLVMVCVVFLFVLAKKRKQSQEQIESMLVVSTHELKTPLSAIQALLQSLSIGSIPFAHAQKYLQLGLGECHKLQHLIESMLAYQRAMVDAKQEVPSGFVFEHLFSVLEHRQKTVLTEHIDTALFYEYAQAHPLLKVYFHPDGLRVILENLLDNAQKYGRSKEVPVQISCTEEGAFFMLLIKDFGQGFLPTEHNLLFVPYFRTAQTAQQVHHGSGLGLYIARKLARQMGGDLCAKSEGLGSGSTFILKLRKFF